MKKDSKLELRTPLKRAMGNGSAHKGTKNFKRQFLTSVLNIPLFIIFVFLIAMLLQKDYASAKILINNPFVSALFILMLLSGIIHMNLGMRVVIEDYISEYHLRTFVLILNYIFCFGLGILSILSVLKISIGV